MPRDLRWTGGIANREWQRGTQPTSHVIDQERITADVRSYIRLCRKYAAMLSPQYHPTADGAVKIIWHQGDTEADAIRAEYQRQTEATP